jgi:hydroxymethylglutaryl-CoA reductase (NADPH)
MEQQWRVGAIGSALIGSFGIQGHYANGLTAMFIACGQDVACVAESAVGVSRLEITEEGDLYGAVTLPNLMVGTVGGGTSLPSQKACLQMMGLHGAEKAKHLAEVCVAVVLAGELSINAALSCGHFTRAHQRLARGRHQAVEAK